MAEINPENMNDESMPEDLLSPEKIEALEQEIANGEEGDENVSDSGPIAYADGLDIIGQYEIYILRLTGEMNEIVGDITDLEATIKTLKNSVQFDVEEEWREKKTPTLSNDKLRQIEVEKRLADNEELKELEDKIKTHRKEINEYKNRIDVETIYMKNERRAFDMMLALNRIG
jgi:anti-sigma28 factor (negative regulator of flagellin synthesis)